MHYRLFQQTLINNAGIYSGKYTESEDGIDKTFAVNHLTMVLAVTFGKGLKTFRLIFRLLKLKYSYLTIKHDFISTILYSNS
jgi:hypothetical protein